MCVAAVVQYQRVLSQALLLQLLRVYSLLKSNVRRSSAADKASARCAMASSLMPFSAQELHVRERERGVETDRGAGTLLHDMPSRYQRVQGVAQPCKRPVLVQASRHHRG